MTSKQKVITIIPADLGQRFKNKNLKYLIITLDFLLMQQ